MRYKKTEICQTCAKLKNVCQTCLFDLDFGLPVEVRDQYLDQSKQMLMPKDEANKNYWANNINSQIDQVQLPYNDASLKEQLGAVAQTHQDARTMKRNQAHVCSFFVRGECNRGKTCPYRHTDITDADLESMKKGNGSVDQKIKNRYHGINDPVATKILGKIKERGKVPDPPEDKNITTLFLGGVTDCTEEQTKELLEQWGRIVRVKLIPDKHCGFVLYQAREGAEKCMLEMFNRCYINEQEIKLLWAKQQLGEKGKRPVEVKKPKLVAYSDSNSD